MIIIPEPTGSTWNRRLEREPLRVMLVDAHGTACRVRPGLRLYFTHKNNALHAYDPEGERLRFLGADGVSSDVLFVAPGWAPASTRELLLALAQGAGARGKCEPVGTTSAGAGNHAYMLME